MQDFIKSEVRKVKKVLLIIGLLALATLVGCRKERKENYPFTPPWWTQQTYPDGTPGVVDLRL
jgi:hypothetical protein